MRPFCQGWPEELFAGVVDQIVAITVKYDGDATIAVDHDPEATMRMIVDLNTLAGRSAEVRTELSTD